MAKAQSSPMGQLLDQIAAQVEELTAKRAIADKAEAEFNKANAELSQATAKLTDLRSQMHDALGGTLNEVGRVRQTN